MGIRVPIKLNRSLLSFGVNWYWHRAQFWNGRQYMPVTRSSDYRLVLGDDQFTLPFSINAQLDKNTSIELYVNIPITWPTVPQLAIHNGPEGYIDEDGGWEVTEELEWKPGKDLLPYSLDIFSGKILFKNFSASLEIFYLYTERVETKIAFGYKYEF